MKRFLLLYSAYMVLAFLLVDYAPIRQMLQLDAVYTRGVVILSAALIDVIGMPVTIDGALLRLEHSAMLVKFGCNGLEAVLLYAAAVLAYPATPRIRLLGIGTGFTILWILNLIRIAFLAWVLEYHQEQFDLMHAYVTQSIMIALAFMVFIVYLQKVTNEQTVGH